MNGNRFVLLGVSTLLMLSGLAFSATENNLVEANKVLKTEPTKAAEKHKKSPNKNAIKTPNKKADASKLSFVVWKLTLKKDMLAQGASEQLVNQIIQSLTFYSDCEAAHENAESSHDKCETVKH
ncbi:MAG: hypothetical protein Q9M92_09720, partial [Enterobacterales bacterium]|nr:hypothetical protein [Enterobacterales bacterium]